MKSLFDKFVPTGTAFRPRTATDLFALRLAQKLDDTAAVRHYAAFVESYPESQLLCAYRRALRTSINGDRARRFHLELERTHSTVNNGRIRLIAIRVERRAVAAAIFHGEHLEYTDSRQLSSVSNKALDSAVSFIVWLLRRFPAESAAIESIPGTPNGHEFQRRVLHDAICEVLRDHMLTIWEIPKAVLLEGCGYPSLKARGELREMATTVWPVLAGTHAKVLIQDAAALGIHVQTERLFIIN